MEKTLSLAEVLGNFEKHIARLRSEAAMHAEREGFHRDRRTELEAELELVVRRYEAFQGAMQQEIPRDPEPPPAPAPSPEMLRLLGLRRLRLASLVLEVVQRRGPQERFGAKAITAELRSLLGSHPRLQGRLDQRRVQISLRWLAQNRKIVEAVKGRPHWEAQYIRQ